MFLMNDREVEVTVLDVAPGTTGVRHYLVTAVINGVEVSGIHAATADAWDVHGPIYDQWEYETRRISTETWVGGMIVVDTPLGEHVIAMQVKAI